ncbi:hypothetical protein TWF694_000702 [Orbilia ellipsospora]|uniref:Uncharacterized protein n=1 Tax=Orbilia ellipsospora TaxID=2528407 RepID=A0AAV9XPC9_9PEZI
MKSRLSTAGLLWACFILVQQTLAYHVNVKWVGVNPLDNHGLTNGDKIIYTQSGVPSCRTLRRPRHSNGLVEAVSVLNGFDQELIPAIGFWISPGCTGDPAVFVKWIAEPDAKIWELVDFNRLADADGDSMVGSYLSWRPILSNELLVGRRFENYRKPSGLKIGGYVIVDGDTDHPIRGAPFIGADAGSGPIVQYGIAREDMTEGQAVLEGLGVLLAINFPDANTPVLPSRSRTEIPTKFGIELELDENESSHQRLRLQDTSMPILRENYGGRLPGYEEPVPELIPRIVDDMLRGSQFFTQDEVPTGMGKFYTPTVKEGGTVADEFESWKDLEPPLHQNILDKFARNFGRNKAGYNRAYAYPGLGPAMQSAFKRLDVNPRGRMPETIGDVVLGPSFFADLFRGAPGSDPFVNMGLDPGELATAYRNQQNINFRNANQNVRNYLNQPNGPVPALPNLGDALASNQVSDLVGKRIFENLGRNYADFTNSNYQEDQERPRRLNQGSIPPVKRVYRKLQPLTQQVNVDPNGITVIQEEGVESVEDNEGPTSPHMIYEEDLLDSPIVDPLENLESEETNTRVQDILMSNWAPPNKQSTDWYHDPARDLEKDKNDLF